MTARAARHRHYAVAPAMEAVRSLPARRVLVAPEWIAAGALGASVVASYLLAAGMASSSTFFVTWSQRPG